MTKKRAISLADRWSRGIPCSVREGEAEAYHKMFLNMLIEEENKTETTKDKKEPLTLDEIKKMLGHCVWISSTEDLSQSGWMYIYYVSETHIFDWNCVKSLSFDEYKTKWVAYRGKPEDV